MFDSIFELITLAASNHLFIFCCCNLIIAAVLVASKSGSGGGCAGKIPVSLAVNTRSNRDSGMDNKPIAHENEILTNVNEASDSAEAEVSGEEETDNGDDGNEDHDENEDCNDDDELRRRAELFIEMVNKGWKAETRGPRV